MEALPVLPSVAGRPPIPCVSLGLYPTLQGSDLDKRFCPQLLLTGLGGMRGGTTEGDREGRDTYRHGEGAAAIPGTQRIWELLAAWITT